LTFKSINEVYSTWINRNPNRW